MITAIARKIAAKVRRIEALSQMGDNTHHHDQLITWVSFNPINRMVRAPVKLMPPEEEEDEEDISGNWGEEALPVPHEVSIGHL